jgi:hypothetical protein
MIHMLTDGVNWLFDNLPLCIISGYHSIFFDIDNLCDFLN